MPQAQIDKDMEEILSSIRQIIADDVEESTKNKNSKLEPSLDSKAVKTEFKENTDEDILELTNMLPEDVYKGPLEKGFEQTQVVEQQLLGAMEKAFSGNSYAIEKSESLISSEVAQEVSQTVEDLSHFIKQTGVQKEILNSTVEDMVRESLQPLLRAWIDQNLSKLVKEVVAEQLEKILKK